MFVFWTCFVTTTNLQVLMPPLIIKGKYAMAVLLALYQTPSPLPSAEFPIRTHALPRKLTVSNLRKIHPARCMGEISMHSITFAYLTRPTLPILRDVSLYLPTNENHFHRRQASPQSPPSSRGSTRPILDRSTSMTRTPHTLTASG